MQAIKETNFHFQGQTDFYRGKVRDVYSFGEKIVMIATDRISAFDVVLPRAIPRKGQVLNQIAQINLEATRDIVKNWVLEVPDPNVTIGIKCKPSPIEMVIRGYLTGHAWREYKSGKRSICGVSMQNGLRENDPFPEPIITPATKETEGHDIDISEAQIIDRGLVSAGDYKQMAAITRKLFDRGSQLASNRGLILVDTKYEFGKFNGEIYLIDEIHTPDSSRYFYKNTYEDNQVKDQNQRQLSKEFVRQWLISKGFQGREGEQVPEMTDEVVNRISDRYKELFRSFTGRELEGCDTDNIINRIEESINKSIKNVNFSTDLY